MPCAPWTPSVAITVRVLEVYRVAHSRCPQLAIKSFVKTLCDLHGTPYQPYLRQQFSIAYDLYLDLLRRTEMKVLASLGRNSFSWRLKHVCNSLKRILRREKVVSDDDGAEFVVGDSKEYENSREAGDNYYLSREKVNKWSKHRIAALMLMKSIEVSFSTRYKDKL
ncbi:hypothetical protein C8R45DRAFT_849977 [Mycena sanguinolenta]|nr:hypothetical protein C8R45DRAFT_849977 [Mycena sanguinolenta]